MRGRIIHECGFLGASRLSGEQGRITKRNIVPSFRLLRSWFETTTVSRSHLFQGENIKFTGGDIGSEWGLVSGDQAVYAFLLGTYHFPHAIDTSVEMAYGSPTGFNDYAGSGRGDDLFNVNLRGTKRFNLEKGMALEAFVEVFNLFNRVNYGVYVDHRQFDDFNVPNPNDSRPYGDMLTPPRTVQLGFRVAF